MDMKDASAMTEASGLTDEQSGIGQAAYPRRQPLQTRSDEFAMRLANRLRTLAVKAPLGSLLAAFLVGVWVARRR